MTTTVVMLGVFVWALIFALGLHRATKRYGPVLHDWTWLIVVLGTGPVLLWLAVIYPLEQWIYIPLAFFLACVPVATFSVYRVWEKSKKRIERDKNGDS